MALLTSLAALGLAAAVAVPPAAAGRDVAPRNLVVAMHLPDAGFQVGAVRGGRVTFAAGFEADLARILARRLEAPSPSLVQVVDTARLTAPGPKRWSLALARLVPKRATRGVRFSTPYLRADQAVLARRGLPEPAGLADLARMQLCALQGSRGADVIRTRIRPSAAPLAARDENELLRWVQTGRCDAALREAPLLGVALEGRRAQMGRIVGMVETGAAYAVALPRGSALAPAVDRAIVRLRGDGTLHRLALRWLGFDPGRLRRLD